jgi:hypothetical protein
MAVRSSILEINKGICDNCKLLEEVVLAVSRKEMVPKGILVLLLLLRK